jgi:hypothetical protein
MKRVTFTVVAWTEPPESADFVPRMQGGLHSLAAAKMWAKIFAPQKKYFTGGVTIYKELEDYAEIVASYEIPLKSKAILALIEGGAK